MDHLRTYTHNCHNHGPKPLLVCRSLTSCHTSKDLFCPHLSGLELIHIGSCCQHLTKITGGWGQDCLEQQKMHQSQTRNVRYSVDAVLLMDQDVWSSMSKLGSGCVQPVHMSHSPQQHMPLTRSLCSCQNLSSPVRLGQWENHARHLDSTSVVIGRLARLALKTCRNSSTCKADPGRTGWIQLHIATPQDIKWPAANWLVRKPILIIHTDTIICTRLSQTSLQHGSQVRIQSLNETNETIHFQKSAWELCM